MTTPIPTMDAIEAGQFRETLTAAVRQHEVRYTDAHSLSMRWEKDDTEADKDTARFQMMLQALHFPAAHELVIKENDSTPGWTARGKIRETLAAARRTSGRSIVIVHYAGHGELDSSRDLMLGKTSRFSADRFLISLALDKVYDLQNTTNVDVLFILDCCYGYAACRASEVTDRVVELV
ncbi:uncharacterized protein TRUGW13939_08924 [Talaromyces rugulosus]|uniref:Peptidase C14 caspase domain-containing protein n=1 Tax=Talaromyces rugulosus TaxID=121627 RepID=A0A7H8R722_TALRU|nr:uncharacterized protein TRUGW13939_08924 [Talaromyces rugulosus]QKX61768.1 hypothetical protein TRUGW13939_08924 [Talaromyces rugulosus]